MMLLQLRDPLDIFIKRREFLTDSGFLSRCDMTYAVESNLITIPSFLPFKTIEPYNFFCILTDTCVPAITCSFENQALCGYQLTAGSNFMWKRTTTMVPIDPPKLDKGNKLNLETSRGLILSSENFNHSCFCQS